MGTFNCNRRDFLKKAGLGAAAIAVSGPEIAAGASWSDKPKLAVDPTEKFELSPYLYMQFMEPLGVTDGSVEAAWDFKNDRWRQDVIDITKELGTTMIRWGGCLSSYYRWKEGVGPRDKRIPMINLLWGGTESNQIGTAEFVDFCRQVGADPLMSVNFESDGRKHWEVDARGSVRCAGPQEAAEWVDYCNNPSNVLRRSHGIKEPVRIGMWQIGNETSYDKKGYDFETAARRTAVFAKAMRKADPSIKLIGWGDIGRGDINWSKRMTEVAGEHLQYLAFHHMFNPDYKDKPVLRDAEYRKDADATWQCLMGAWKIHEAKIKKVREQSAGCGIPLALTECHFTVRGRNRNEVMSSWAAGAAYARVLNVHERHGDVLKIATAADFCGTRWQNNAIMISVPWGKSYMQPVARVMQLYRHHCGQKFVNVTNVPDGLDVTASRTGDKIFLHVVNTNRKWPVGVNLAVKGMKIKSGKVFEIAADSEFEVMPRLNDVLAPKQRQLPKDGLWTFPSASVSAVELDIQQA